MFADLLQLRYADLQAFTRISEFKNIHSDTNYLLKIPDSKFHSAVCKPQNESDTKTFQNNHDSGKISSRALKGAISRYCFKNVSSGQLNPKLFLFSVVSDGTAQNRPNCNRAMAVHWICLHSIQVISI